jgi:hypothetical protein
MEMLKEGDYKKAPLLIGSNRDEGTLKGLFNHTAQCNFSFHQLRRKYHTRQSWLQKSSIFHGFCHALPFSMKAELEPRCT